MKTTLVLLPAFLFALLLVPATVSAEEPRVEFRDDASAGQMRVLVDGEEAFVYQYGPSQDLVHLFPIRSPGGKSMTVQRTDPYPHHRSFWFADKVRLEKERTVEFYGALYSAADRKNPPFRDHVRHVEFDMKPAEGNRAEAVARLVWEMDNDKPVLDERRDMRVVALGGREYLLDVTFTLTAAHGDVAFVSDAVHYAWPYVRMNSRFSVAGGGTIVNSEGGVNQQGTNGRPALWVDYSNTVDGETAGLAVFSHPDNDRPHGWLTRDYGTFGPRRVDAKSGKPFTLAKGETIACRVGVLVHKGDVETGSVAERFELYATDKL